MEVVSGIIRDLVILAFISLLLELLLPRGNMAKYARLVMGLLVIMVITQPLLSLSGVDWEDIPAVVFHAEDDTAVILAEGEEISAGWSEQALAEYEETVAAQVEAMALTVEGVEDAKAEAVIADDALSSVAIVLTLAGDVNMEDAAVVRDIRRQTEDVLGKFFELPSGEIEVSIARLAD